MTALTNLFQNSITGSKVEKFLFNYQNREFTVVYETIGQGDPILLLPAFSTVSSRTEVAAIAQSLASEFQVFTLDWLGFGESDRPPLNYQPEIFDRLLEDLVQSIFQTPIIIIAAGHASGYALKLAQNHSDRVAKIVLIAPTWRGPLPTMGMSRSIATIIRELVRSPLLGQFLYYLNTQPSFLRWMYRRHVYVNESKLTPEFMAQKYQMTQKPGARFAPAAFVTGAIDPVNSRSAFLSILESLSMPIFAILAENAPPKSGAEMAAISEIPRLQSVTLPGTLGMHEENSELITESIRQFLIQN